MSDRPSRFIAARDGLRLHYLDFAGDPGKTPVVCLPGLARSADDFVPLAQRFAAQGRRVLALDYRGRGDSQWDRDWRHYALDVEQTIFSLPSPTPASRRDLLRHVRAAACTS